MNTVEIFKTNVLEKESAGKLVQQLQHIFPSCRINFDLDDCDKILRIEGQHVAAQQVVLFLTKEGFLCQLLD